MNKLIFRQYDIRGIVKDDLTPDVVELLGRGFASWVINEGGKTVSIGRDGRLTGPDLRDAFIKGARAAGADVIDIGMVPTPLLYFSIYHLHCDGAVMITGSHNPPEFNGFKMMMGKKTVFGDMIQDLLVRIESENFTSGNGSYKEVDLKQEYIDHIASDIKIPQKLKVALDSGNGVGGISAPPLFRKLGLEPVELFSDVDGNFPNHHPDPTVAENLVHLHKAVMDNNLDCGIAFDGDADRIGVVDDKGTILWGDRLLALFARYMLKNHPGATVIGEVKCSKALYDDIAKHGGNPIMWKTGHSFLKNKLQETGAKLAGEMSGHMFFNDRYFGYDDAIYAAARLVEIIATEGKPLSELLADLPVYPITPEMRVDCPDEIKFKVVDIVSEYFKSKYDDVVDIDGVRINFEHGWGLVRSSNTQPVLVMRFEADTEERMLAYQKEVEDKVAEVRDSIG
jgi:phosphomannomutase / phosphoglucomutase